MENHILYEKTAKGALQAGGRSRVLTEELQRLLEAVDGATSAGDLARDHGSGQPRVVILGLRRLSDMGFIRVASPPQGSAANAASTGAVTGDLDFTTLAE